MKHLVLAAIRLYQRHTAAKFSYPVCCKRVSCSRFATKVIKRYGLVRGCAIASTRIHTCR